MHLCPPLQEVNPLRQVVNFFHEFFPPFRLVDNTSTHRYTRIHIATVTQSNALCITLSSSAYRSVYTMAYRSHHTMACRSVQTHQTSAQQSSHTLHTVPTASQKGVNFERLKRPTKIFPAANESSCLFRPPALLCYHLSNQHHVWQGSNEDTSTQLLTALPLQHSPGEGTTPKTSNTCY